MYPAAYPHDEIIELYPDLFLLHGSIKVAPMTLISRNMVIIRSGNELTLINPVRMNDQSLASLDALGKVVRVVRLGDFHGLDDAFYIDRYNCEFWAQAGQETYKTPEPTTVFDASTISPIPNTEFFIFETALFPEAALFIKEHGLLITTDAVQYYGDWSYFNLSSKLAFKVLGFRFGINIGPIWLKRVTPKGRSMRRDFERLLEFDFDALISAHGTLLESGAKQQLKELVSRTF